jgi:hypothetical protein
VLGDAKLDAAAATAGEQLHVEDALANLGPLAHQRRPPATDPADPKVLDSERLERALAPQTAVGHLLRCHLEILEGQRSDAESWLY